MYTKYVFWFGLYYDRFRLKTINNFNNTLGQKFSQTASRDFILLVSCIKYRITLNIICIIHKNTLMWKSIRCGSLKFKNMVHAAKSLRTSTLN